MEMLSPRPGIDFGACLFTTRHTQGWFALLLAYLSAGHLLLCFEDGDTLNYAIMGLELQPIGSIGSVLFLAMSSHCRCNVDTHTCMPEASNMSWGSHAGAVLVPPFQAISSHSLSSGS